MIDHHRRRCEQLGKDIASLQSQKSKEVKKVADAAKKTNAASKAMQQSKSTSTINSKMREIERHQKDRERAESKIAELEGKISRKEQELGRAKSSLAQAEDQEAKKRQREEDRRLKEREKQLQRMNQTLKTHDKLHVEARLRIEELARLPESIKVLFLAANPLDQNNLRLDEEIRAIEEMIRKSEYRDSVHLVSKWAIRPQDVLQGMNEHDPHIVHFSGHGSDTDEIIFQDNQGNSKPVAKEAIVQTMRAASGNLRLVFFNTCYSHAQAREVVQHVEAAIGMKTTIGDDAARVFASQFYSAIGFGKSLATAFEQAKALLMMEGIPEEDTPELFVSDSTTAERIVIVKPSGIGEGT